MWTSEAPTEAGGVYLFHGWRSVFFKGQHPKTLIVRPTRSYESIQLIFMTDGVSFFPSDQPIGKWLKIEEMPSLEDLK